MQHTAMRGRCVCTRRDELHCVDAGATVRNKCWIRVCLLIVLGRLSTKIFISSGSEVAKPSILSKEMFCHGTVEILVVFTDRQSCFMHCKDDRCSQTRIDSQLLMKMVLMA